MCQFNVYIHEDYGGRVRFRASTTSTVKDLKRWISRKSGLPRRRQMLVHDGVILIDSELLSTLASEENFHPWCVILDLVPMDIRVDLSILTLQFKVIPEVTECDACGAVGMNRCCPCLSVRYCSLTCQGYHWRTHRLVCKAKKSVASG